MDTRKEDRFYGIKNISLKDDDGEYDAILTSISNTGVSVICDKTFPTYKEIEIKLYFEGKSITINGSVRWINDHKGEAGSNLKETGISFVNIPDEYLKYMEKIGEK